MPLFTKFKKAKDAAVEHKKTAAVEHDKPPAAPYKHVPTHAKQDALATQPTTVRPEELQARIAAARKRRASSYQSPVASRHSVYHSCESSRATSRTNSTAEFVPMSASTSFKGKGKSAESIDTILRRPHSISNGLAPPIASGRSNLSPLSSVPGGALTFPFPATQRPRPTHTRSRRSSFAKRKSPLSMSVEEGTLDHLVVMVLQLIQCTEPDEMFSSSSNTSAASTRKLIPVDLSGRFADTRTESSATNESRDSSSDDDKVREGATAVAPSRPSELTPVVKITLPQSASLARNRSRWSMFQRRSMDITAH
jgi:hypothetical protein